MNSPQITIIVTLYNLENKISKCIESCINQSFTDIEILIINDGSADNSVEIVKTFLEKDDRVKLFTKINEGVNLARKFGLEQSIGEFVFYLDGDDTISNNCLECLHSAILKSNADMAVGTMLLKKEGKNYKACNYSNFGIGNGIDFLNYILENRLHYLCGILISRKIYDNYISVKKELVMGEDQIHLFQICHYASTVTTIRDVCYNYLIQSSSITQRKLKNEFFTKQQEIYAGELINFKRQFKLDNSINDQIDFRILMSFYKGIHRSGKFIIKKPSSMLLFKKTIWNSIRHKRKAFLFNHLNLIIRCVIATISPNLIYKLANKSK